MSQAVVDASLCGAWILPDEASPRAEKILAGIAQGSLELVVPALWHYEMVNLLRSALRRKRIGPDDARGALDALALVPVVHEDIPEASARRRILYLAGQFDLSAYDAAYLELADRFKIPLHSTDGKLVAAATRLGLLS